MISKFRPACPIISPTSSKKVLYQLALSWGVIPVLSEEQSTTDELFDHAIERAMNTGLLQNGDTIVLTAGVPVGISGTTNILKVHTVGHVLVKGQGITNQSISGRVYALQIMRMQHLKNFEKGNILLFPKYQKK